MNELVIPKVDGVTFEPPDTFFTFDGDGSNNPRSVKVVEHLRQIAPDIGPYKSIICHTVTEAKQLAHANSVAIFDGCVGMRNEFKPGRTDTVGAPGWTNGTIWCVQVGQKCAEKPRRLERCARQARGTYVKRFQIELDQRHYPWGQPKRGDNGPVEIIRIDPKVIEQRVAGLNRGPDLANAIADTKHALELPVGSRISWVNVMPEPVGYSRETMQLVTSAMRNFEQACQVLIGQDECVRKAVMFGVHIIEPRLQQIYLNPGVSCFTVARPDLHWGPHGLSASENDEMPGGMPELVLLCQAYGVDQDRWKSFFSLLTKNGPVAFVVSHQWSKCYIPEITWLVTHMVESGFDARIITTDKMDELRVTTEGVYHKGDRVGTIWRQFPIFETAEKLADLVVAARNGLVAMYPEWGHFGNKAWFHLFWKHQDWFGQNLDPSTFQLLQKVLPRSCLVQDQASFPLNVGDSPIADINELESLGEWRRDQLVLKITGANHLAARSYGVLMGRGIRANDWSEWIRARMSAREPFLVQRMFDTGIASLPVWNTKSQRSSMFRCRLLMRPWVVNGEIVAVHGCAVPRECFKVHGMVSMAVSPIVLF